MKIADSGDIRLYGWDSTTETWYGPDDLEACGAADKRLLRALESASGKSWYGPITCGTAGETPGRFFALVHDLPDCAVASIYCDESKAGPAVILAVIPERRRRRLREDFAFEFLTYARFLGVIREGSELRVHDAIATALAQPHESNTLVFSVSSGLWPCDQEHVLSTCTEKLLLALNHWLP